MAQGKPFKGAVAPNLVGKQWFDTIKLEELVAFLAQRLPRKTGDNEAIVRNRVSTMIYYATRKAKREKLRCIAPRRFRLGDIAEWIMKMKWSQKWPGLFDDVPGTPGTGSVEGRLGRLACTARGYSLPNSLEEAHREIHALQAEKIRLEQALAEGQQDVRGPEPEVESMTNPETQEEQALPTLRELIEKRI